MLTVINIRFYFVCLSLLLLTACKKDVSDTIKNPELPFVPTVYAVGTPQGAAVQKTIGSAGGTITNTDGTFSVTVPAGALTIPVQLSIQPINNSLPHSPGQAYRLLPAGTLFLKPVTISVIYTDALAVGFDENAFDIVRQDAAGIWRTVTSTSLNKATKTLTATTSKTGDFAFTGYSFMEAQQVTLEAGQSTTLTIKTLPLAPQEIDGELPIGAVTTVDQAAELEGWQKEGEGQLSSQKATATYTAPAAINGVQEITIKANVKNQRRSRNSANGNVLLKRRLTIGSGSFFSGTYDGQPFTCMDAVGSYGNGLILIQGVTAAGKQLSIFITGSGAGDFSYAEGEPNTALIATDLKDDNVYTSSIVMPCVYSAYSKNSSGTLSVKTFTAQTIAGDFSATLYDAQNCQVKTKSITGSFRVKRI